MSYPFAVKSSVLAHVGGELVVTKEIITNVHQVAQNVQVDDQFEPPIENDDDTFVIGDDEGEDHTDSLSSRMKRYEVQEREPEQESCEAGEDLSKEEGINASQAINSSPIRPVSRSNKWNISLKLTI